MSTRPNVGGPIAARQGTTCRSLLRTALARGGRRAPQGMGKTGMNSHGERPDSFIAETSIFTASPTPWGVTGTPADREGAPPTFAIPSLAPAHWRALTAC